MSDERHDVDHGRNIVFGAAFGGIGPSRAWMHPQQGSQNAIASHRFLARSAERALLDFVFYAETLSVPESANGRLSSNPAGRPETLAMLPSIAAATSHIGMVATCNTTYNDPFDLARRFASLELLSGGRSGFNIVTSATAPTVGNFCRGDFLPREKRYEYAEEFLSVTKALWAAEAGQQVDHEGEFFSLRAVQPLPGSPQGRPVLIQAGDSDRGRDVAASSADVLFTHYQASADAARDFRQDIRTRLRKFGRSEEALKILPAVFVHVGDSDDEAEEEAKYLRRTMVTDVVVREFLEPYWGRDLSEHDLDGPLPAADPDWDVVQEYTSRLQTGERDARTAVGSLRAEAAQDDLSMRDLVTRRVTRPHWWHTGSATTVATALADRFLAGCEDGYILCHPVLPGGFTRFYDEVLPLLRERGLFRSQYEGSTFRSNLGLA
ncbi:MAG: F420-dependent methylene-tetrahydromethanopterin reductase [Aeromicrobium sp.]|nr:F420-dependent methylene-tetrahydromethanopterin reductase [Aeromicrobium sp.]